MRERLKGCEGCGFVGGIGTKIEVCDYFGYTGQLRGCPGGAECTKRMSPEAVVEKYGDARRRLVALDNPAAKFRRTASEVAMRREDRDDIARQLGLSQKAAEALYGGSKK